MADLSEMYRFAAQSIPGYGDFAKGAAASQELMNNQLAYQKAKEDFEAQRGLRALFQENPNAGYADVAQYSPALAQEMMKNQFATAKDLLEMQKTKGDIAEKQFKLNADQEKELGHAHGAVVEAYDQLVSRGVNPQQAATMVAPLAGQLTAQLAERGIQTSQSFDPSVITPQAIEHMRLSARKHQFPLSQDKLYQEQQQALVPPRMSAEQAYGGVESSPYGYKYKPPLPSAGAAPQAQPTGNIPAPTIEFEGQTYTGPQFAKAFMAETDPARRAKMNEYIDASIASQQQGLPQAQFITPEQESALRLKEEREKAQIGTEAATEKKTGELSAQQKFSNKQAIDAYLRLRPPHEITKLIRESIQGGGADKINQLANLMGVSLPEATPSAALEVIAQQMVASKPFPPGSQSEKELEARMKSIGDPASKVPAEQRLAQFEEFMRDQEALIAQQGEFSDEQLIDLVNKGYINKNTAAEVYKRMHRGK